MKKFFFVLLMFSLLALPGCSPKSSEEAIGDTYQDSPASDTIDASTPNTDTTMKTFDQTAQPEKGEEIVVMETSKGTIKIRLFPEYAPKTVENFVGLIKKNYYDGLIFHRVIPDFMIQGGDPTGTGRGGESLWGGKFNDEFNPNLKNLRGTLSMANAGPNTNGSQFFIVEAPATPWLDGKHTVFGQVFEGLDVVDAIVNVDRDGNDKPLKDVLMKKVTVSNWEG